MRGVTAGPGVVPGVEVAPVARPPARPPARPSLRAPPPDHPDHADHAHAPIHAPGVGVGRGLPVVLALVPDLDPQTRGATKTAATPLLRQYWAPGPHLTWVLVPHQHPLVWVLGPRDPAYLLTGWERRTEGISCS